MFKFLNLMDEKWAKNNFWWELVFFFFLGNFPKLMSLDKLKSTLHPRQCEPTDY